MTYQSPRQADWSSCGGCGDWYRDGYSSDKYGMVRSVWVVPVCLATAIAACGKNRSIQVEQVESAFSTIELYQHPPLHLQTQLQACTPHALLAMLEYAT